MRSASFYLSNPCFTGKEKFVTMLLQCIERATVNFNFNFVNLMRCNATIK